MTTFVLAMFALLSLTRGGSQEPTLVVDENAIIAAAIERAQSEDARRFTLAPASDVVAPWVTSDRELYAQFDVGGEARRLPARLFVSARTNNEHPIGLDAIAARLGMSIARTPCSGSPLVHASRPGFSEDGTEAIVAIAIDAQGRCADPRILGDSSQGATFLLRRQSNDWRVVGRGAIWTT